MPIEFIGQGKHLELIKDGQWEYCRRITNMDGSLRSIQDVVFIVPLIEDPEPSLIFITEYRHAVESNVIGFPAGLVGDVRKETKREAAHTELLEETGYKAGEMTYLTEGPPSAGMSNESLTFYLATDLEKVATPEKGIKVDIIPLSDLDFITLGGIIPDPFAKNCSVIDPKTFLGLYFVEKYLKNRSKFAGTYDSL